MDYTMVSPPASAPVLQREVPDTRSLGFLPEGARVEIEAKYLIEDAEQVNALIDALQLYDVQSASAVDVVDSYWDTPDWHLFNAGWAYRWRDASGDKTLTLKSLEMGNGAVHKRLEVEEQVAAFPGNNGHSRIVARVTEHLNGAGSGELHELFRVHNYRRLFGVRVPDGSLVQIAVDQATITTKLPVPKPAPGRMSFLEVELELEDGREESLLHLATTLERRFGLLPSRLSKFDRGLQAAGLSAPRAPQQSWPLRDTPYVRRLHEQELSAADPAVHLAYRCLIEQFEEMLVQEPKAWEGLDPEGVHQMRVCTRRLRAAFRAFRDVLPASAVLSFNREFKWVAAVLGKVRDLDVYRDNLDHYAAEVAAADTAHAGDYERHLDDQWRKARRRLVACLTSRRYERLKDRFARFLMRGPSRRAMKAFGGVTIAEAAQQLIGKRYKTLRRDGRVITPASPSESLHAVRIQCKRLRYLFEFFAPIYGSELKPEIKRLRKLQDVLGEFQDACVATEQLRQYAEGVPMRTRNRGQLIALGQLISGQNRQAAVRRAGFPRAWRKFDRRGGRKAVLARLGGPGRLPSS